MLIRPGESRDVAEIRAIQAACPQSAQWDATQYLSFSLSVAQVGMRVAGFLAARTLAPGECELLDLAVAPEFRRQGIGRSLLEAWFQRSPGTIFLEVRPSNVGARTFYKSLGFKEVSSRPEYYHNPPEAAIVMKFHSC